MPLEKSYNVSPYFDDYDAAKDYYKVMFKPGVSVQTRELNQLQTMLQNQIEKFGDHIFKSGTILSGVNFSYLPSYSYIKILDTQTDGQPSLPSSYVDYFVKTNLNLTARIVNYQDGLETKTPDLKTLYLQYVSSSDADTANSNTSYTAFAPGQNLTVFSKDYPLFKVTVNNGGLGVANADSVVVMSSITVTGNSVAFSNGETLTQSTTGAKVTIASINTTAVANTIILQVKPRTVDLTNNSVTSTGWTLSTGYNVVGGTSGATANVVSLIGSGAQGLITTDTQGIVQTITLSSTGNNYTYLPTVSVKTTNTTATVGSLDLTPQNYKTIVTVANAAVNSVGTGYAFGVSGGTIYQKGYFLRVDPQVVIVSKYTTTPNNVAVGFVTDEATITAFADETLYDNASNTTNYAAPGADRLNLTPVLTVVTASDISSNATFLSLAEWKDGQPFRENKTTVYSNIGDEMARRTREAQGNFVINPFEISSKELSTANTTNVQAIVDPGAGYINGYRIVSDYNTYLDVPRANTRETQTSRTVTINYGNYVLIKELAGMFKFKAGDTVALYDTAKSYITNGTIGSDTNITPAGNQIGSARMRSLVLNSGNPGTSSCTYRMYLFDVQMNAGYSFRNVRSLYYNNTEDGIADVALTYDATTAANVAVLVDKTLDQMLFNSGQAAVSSIPSLTYQYRTSSDASLQLTSGGTLAIGPLGTGLTFPYSDGVLSSTNERDFIVFPLANTQSAANVTGTVAVTTTSNVATGTGTTFATDFAVGDFIKVNNSANTAQTAIRQITYITNNTSMGLNANAQYAITGNTAVVFYPAMYPLALEGRSERTVTISGSSKTATINLTKTLSGTVNAMAMYSVSKTNAAPVTKTINRDLYVKIHTSNNNAGASGPWYLGVPGVARLKNVYLGSNTTVNTSSTDVTKYFYINTGDDENAYRSARLVLANKTALTLTANQYLMVKFDAFTVGGQEGFFTVDSHSINDTANLASSTSTINTLEIPETITKTGAYFDLRDTIDFRPYSTNTAVLSTTVAGASINPANTFALSGDDQFFPTPDSTATFDITYYLPRIDAITVDVNSNFSVINGVPSLTPKPPRSLGKTLLLGKLLVPPYPSLPYALNTTTSEFASKKVGSDRGTIQRRVDRYKLTTSYGRLGNLQPRRYSMQDIGKIERRLQNVEYRLSLDGIEKAITGLSIPSGIAPTLNRFKNAFFVEGFNDFSRASTSHQEFACSIDTQQTTMKPLTKVLNFECQFDTTDATTANSVINGQTLMLPYTEEVFVDQSIKSDVLSVDGHAIQFVGNISVSPSSFSLLAQIEIIPDAPVVTTNVAGSPSSSRGDGSSGVGGTWTGVWAFEKGPNRGLGSTTTGDNNSNDGNDGSWASDNQASGLGDGGSDDSGSSGGD